MDLIPIEGAGVRGSHGRLSTEVSGSPLLVSQSSGLIDASNLNPTDVHDIILAHLQE